MTFSKLFIAYSGGSRRNPLLSLPYAIPLWKPRALQKTGPAEETQGSAAPEARGATGTEKSCSKFLPVAVRCQIKNLEHSNCVFPLSASTLFFPPQKLSAS